MSDATTGALPPGWAELPLGILATESRTGIDPRRYSAEEFELYSIPAHACGTPEAIHGSMIGSAKQTVAPGTVLLGRINPRINRVWVVRDHRNTRQIASTEWIAFPRVSGINPQFLAYYLRRNQLRDFLAHNASGVGGSLMRVKGSTLARYPMPVAPLPEQSRVVECLDAHFTRLDNIREVLDQVDRNLKRFRASVLRTAMEGRLVQTEAEVARAGRRSFESGSELLDRVIAERLKSREAAERGSYPESVAPDASILPDLPEGWCWATVSQLGIVSGGLTKNPKRDALPLRVPYLRVANVYSDELRLDAVEEIGVTSAELERVLLKDGDLLVVEGNGSVDQIGRVAVWNGAIARCAHQNHLIKVRFASPDLAAWTKTYLLSPGGREAIIRVASSTSGLHTLSIGKVSSLVVPLPPMNEIARIRHAVDAALSEVMSISHSTNASQVRISSLRSTILELAFSGRLVDHDAGAQPVSVLLDRIRAERSASTKSSERRPRRVAKRTR